MNWDSIKQPLTTALGMLGGYVVGKGWITLEQWNSLQEVILTIGAGIAIAIPIIRDLMKATNKAKVTAAAQVPGVTKITVAPTATNGLAKAAADPALPNVVKE